MRSTAPSGPPIRLADDGRPRAARQEDRSRLLAISEQPFHVMVEVTTTARPPAGKPRRDAQLWYTNAGSRTIEVLKAADGTSINVLAWTHPDRLSRELQAEEARRAVPFGPVRSWLLGCTMN